MPVFSVLDRVAGVTVADPVLARLTAVANRVPGAARDVLHGVWLGHPLHPVVAQVPLGTWLSAAVLDVVAMLAPDGATRAAADRSAASLLAAGLAGVPLAALPGVTDWARLHPEQQRIGAVHAATNSIAVTLVTASILQRRRGRRAAGRALGLAGVSVAGLAAGMGGHLAFRHAAGPNHAEDVPHRTGEHWTPIDRLELLPDHVPQRRMVGGTPVVAVRRGDDVAVLADTCSHLSGPLSDGSLTDDGRCLVCPWHGSTFDLDDGSVRHGPATAPQPWFDVRIGDGLVEARVRTPEQDAGARRLGEAAAPAHP
jgi:nitrite reductase/ring-hydroxylating ferredoxin subunit/uncharacterized membrane protein